GGVSSARLDELRRRRAEDIAPAFQALQGRADALYVAADPLLNTNRIRVSALAPGARLPTMHGIREYVEAGGLMSYGPNVADNIAAPLKAPMWPPGRLGRTLMREFAKAGGLMSYGTSVTEASRQAGLFARLGSAHEKRLRHRSASLTPTAPSSPA